MAVRWTSEAGVAVATVDAAAGPELIQLTAMTAGRVVRVRRTDSTANTVTVDVVDGLTLDGVASGAVTIPANGTRDFQAIDGGFESYGAAGGGGGGGSTVVASPDGELVVDGVAVSLATDAEVAAAIAAVASAKADVSALAGYVPTSVIATDAGVAAAQVPLKATAGVAVDGDLAAQTPTDPDKPGIYLGEYDGRRRLILNEGRDGSDAPVAVWDINNADGYLTYVRDGVEKFHHGETAAEFKTPVSVPRYATVNLPDPATVPEGSVAYDTTIGDQVQARAGAWARVAPTAAALATDAAFTGKYAPVDSGAWVDITQRGIRCDGSDEGAALQALLGTLTAVGAGAFIPAGKVVTTSTPIQPPAGSRIDGRGTVRMTTVNQPAFDVLNRDSVSISGITIENVATRAYLATGFRGSAGYVYSAGIWSNSERGIFRDLSIKGFTSGIYLNSWTSGSDFTAMKYGNIVQDVTVENVDFGLLAVGQDSPVIRGLRGSYSMAAGSSNPPHLIYWSDGIVGTSASRNVTVAQCAVTSGAESYAFQFKGVRGGTVSGISALNSSGILAVFDCQDVQFSGISSRGNTATSSGMVFFGDALSQRVTVDGVSLQMATESRLARVDGVDCRLSNLSASVNHAATADQAEVTIQGTRCSIDGVSVVNSSTTGGWRVVDVVGGTSPSVKGVRALYCRTGIFINAASSGAIVDVAPNEIVGAVGFGGFRAIDVNSATAEVAQKSRRLTYTGTGGTFTFQPAMATVHEVTLTGATAVTVAAPYPFATTVGMQITVEFYNSRGGAAGVLSWNGAFQFKGGAAVASPAAGQRVSATFTYNGVNWVEVARAPQAVGSTSGTLAAGNDARIVGAVQSSGPIGFYGVAPVARQAAAPAATDAASTQDLVNDLRDKLVTLGLLS